MMHAAKLALSKLQLKKLLTGGTIQVNHAKMGHGHTFHLTTLQHNKLRRHHALGKGMRIHFPLPQIQHHLKHGSGFLDILKSIARPLLGTALTAGTALLPGIVGKVANFAGNKAIDVAGNKLGFGVRRHRKRRVVGCGRKRKVRRGGSFMTIGRHP